MKTTKPIRAFYLDVQTSSGCKELADVIRTIKRYKSTVKVQCDGPYMENRNYSRVYIATTLTETQLEAYLYKNKNTIIDGIIETTVRQ